MNTPIKTYLKLQLFFLLTASKVQTYYAPFLPVVLPLYNVKTTFGACILKPFADNMHYAAEAKPLPLPSPSWNIHDIKPGYHFGFNFEASMEFPAPATQLCINWQHFRTSKDQSDVHLAASDMVGPFFEIGPDAAPYKQAHAQATFSFNELNFTYAQKITLSDRLDGAVFTGISYTNLKQIIEATYANTTNTINRTISSPISFKGAGPRIGLNFAYDITCCTQFVGQAAASFLVGKTHNCTDYRSTAPTLIMANTASPNIQTTTVNARSRIVPSFSQKLGALYSYDLDGYFLQGEIGYQVQLYVNALQSVDIGSEVVTPPITPDTVGVFARTFQRTSSSFGLAGPYLNFTLYF